MESENYKDEFNVIILALTVDLPMIVTQAIAEYRVF